MTRRAAVVLSVAVLAGGGVALAVRAAGIRPVQIVSSSMAPSPWVAGPRVETVPPGHVLVLGDNSRVSIDSRSLGAVPVPEIVAQGVLGGGAPRTPPAYVALLFAAVLLAVIVLRVARSSWPGDATTRGFPRKRPPSGRFREDPPTEHG